MSGNNNSSEISSHMMEIISHDILSVQNGYDMQSYFGRVKYFWKLLETKNLFTTSQDVEIAKRVLSTYLEEGHNHTSLHVADNNTKLNEARWTLLGAMHPISGETIAFPFRMVSWPIFGTLPVGCTQYCARFLPTQPGYQVFWQFVNQTQNASVGYLNGAAAEMGEGGLATFLKGYCGAVTAAMSVSLGIGLISKRCPKRWRFIVPFTPFPAVAIANVVNTVLVRHHEVDKGIEVFADGEVIGKSRVASKRALFETCTTRVLLPAGNFLLSPLVIMPFASVIKKRGPIVRVSIIILATAFVFGNWLPFALALYPQQGEMPVSELEKELQNKTKATSVTYFRGL
eukprot:m.56247 g.56247  ORF g.56247 m.56247 type:complete len:343 (+) comp11026_c0_seq4:84-1112(+)